MNRKKLINLSPEEKADLMVRYVQKHFYYERPEKPIPKTPALIRLRTRREIRISRIQERFNRRFDRFYLSMTTEERCRYYVKAANYCYDKVVDMLFQEAQK